MLPSNPRSGVRGLPINPSPGPRSTGRARPDRETSHASDRPSSSRQGRQPQYSAANPPPRSRSRSRSRPPPTTEPRTPNYSRTSSSRIESQSPRKSDDSVSTSGSSLLSRMKLGSTYTSGSSRTSLEEDYRQPYPKKQSTERDEPPISLRQPSRERPVSKHGKYAESYREGIPPNHSDEDEESAFTFNVSDGAAIWSRVATVASTLTVSVSKAWASNVPTYSGEGTPRQPLSPSKVSLKDCVVTPPGQESRLTRAMKAYHLAKAKDPTDLPPWLFDESARRRPAPTPIAINEDEYNDQTKQQYLDNAPKSRGLRDIYDTAASTPSISTTRSTRGRGHVDNIEQPSKATNRLKAMREAKRSALTANATPRRLPDEVDDGHQSVARDYDHNPKIDRAPRLGLPPGPRRM